MLLIGVAAVLLGLHALSSLALGLRPTELQRGKPLAHKLDLNKATRPELMQLPGVGPKIAEDIEKYRRDHGPFRSVDELTKVAGIGPVRLKRLREWVFVEPDGPQVAAAKKDEAKTKVRNSHYPADAVKQPGWKTPAKMEKIQLGRKINLNTASEEALQTLPRIGPVLARRIIEERTARPFKTVDELRRVRGIGPKTLEQLRPLVSVK
jgi:competence ComEA-like helix-hairpin-helix protein